MISTDRDDFNVLMKKLCVGLGALPSPDRLATYFDNLRKMTLIQFSRVVDECLSERSVIGKLPNIPAVWKIWHEIQDKGRRKVAELAPPIEVKLTKEQKVIDSMMLRYIELRRYKLRHKGDIKILERRKGCHDIVREITEARITDWETDMSSIAGMFKAAMDAIKDDAAPIPGDTGGLEVRRRA